MKDIIRIIDESSISKVSVAKYLGVSRQMLYNYFAHTDFEDLPDDKQNKLLTLFGVKTKADLTKIKVDDAYVADLEARISDGIVDSNNKESLSDFRGLNKNEQQILIDIFTTLKDRLSNDSSELEYKTLRYLLMYIQNMEQLEVLKYILAYVAKSTAQIPMSEYIYDESKQYVFEGIFFSAES